MKIAGGCLKVIHTSHFSSDSEMEETRVDVEKKEQEASQKKKKNKAKNRDAFEVDIRTKGELTLEVSREITSGFIQERVCLNPLVIANLLTNDDIDDSLTEGINLCQKVS